MQVATPEGVTAITSADKYTYANVPEVYGLSPSAGPIGGGTRVTINGDNFVGATLVYFGAISVPFQVMSANQIVATSPAGTLGDSEVVTVTTPNGTSDLTFPSFTYEGAPVITSISPAFGSTGGGTSVQIFGDQNSLASRRSISASAPSPVPFRNPSPRLMSPVRRGWRATWT